MHNTLTSLLNYAMALYPDARRNAVFNFSIGYEHLTMDAEINIRIDTRLYKWNDHTANAIRYVLKNKSSIVPLTC